METINAQNTRDLRATRSEQELYRLVVDGTASEVGQEFFRSLVRNLADALDTLGAWVTEYLAEERRLRALAMWLDGKHVDHFEYPIAGTACQKVVESRSLIHIPDRLVQLFPGDPDLVPLNALSYLGAPILNSDGTMLGHISVLDNKPMPHDPRIISLFQIFAARAAAEHRRLKIEKELREQREQLEQLFETTLDAILVVDDALRIVRTNSAAERLFGCTAEDLLGESFNDFLLNDSAARVNAFAREIQNRPQGQQQLWVPQDFILQRWDHSVFPAEATISRFERGGKTFHTLILRNADQRLDAQRQIALLTQETEYLRAAVREVPGHGDLLGRSHCMQMVFDAVKQVAKTDSTVVIHGETGTGKELVARAIHRGSLRADKPLVTVNCAAIPGTLLESEFFGHERGAFTGAVARREGRFTLANGGTIFLDEVGELPLEVQGKLLRVLQEGEFEPLGSTKTHKVDVRVIAATNRDLRRMSTDSKFREDLFFRLNVFPITVPPLRERGKDVDLLAEAFAQRFARRMGKRIASFSDQHRKLLHGYDWPGNVRELQNVIERATILSQGPEIQLERAMCGAGLPQTVPVKAAPENSPATPRILTAGEMMQLERENLARALESCAWKIAGASGAAQMLGIPPTTLTSRMKALGIQRPAP